ncbi:MAG: hypothetical protein FJZ87_03675 [Chloroflexi bacterium]|nr:hypothetical protein [Chloroflexota bacterium]
MLTPSLPTLRILPIESIILHEDHDNQRTLPLVEKLRAQGILRNPPIVMPLQDGTNRNMVLDGANRVTSLKEMGFPHLVTQVVSPQDPHVSLMTWNHVVWDIKARTLLGNIRRAKDLDVTQVDTHKSMKAPSSLPVQIRTVDGKLFLVQIPNELEQLVRSLHEVVNSYKENGSFDRTSQTLIDSFRTMYADLCALVIFPRFEIQSLLETVGKGWVIPTGITRFTVSPRLLHLNYPLHELSSGKSLEYKEEYLQRWIQERVKKRGVRYYAEATFLFDE